MSFSPITITARAPAKLIISGEHAVLYGQPALALAINRYTTTTTTWHNSPDIHFKLLDLAYVKSHTLSTLKKLSVQLQNNYQEFLHGNLAIREVIKRPFELLQYSVANLLDRMHCQLPRGLAISVASNIPLGCGMGSSAAAVVSTLCALANFFKLNWQRSDLLQFGREIENLQHGRSSGLDIHLSTYGGCVLFAEHNVQTRAHAKLPLYLVNTGRPVASTGECVAHVATIMRNNKDLAENFGAVTLAADRALAHNDQQALNAAIRENHRLLQHIGVVPENVAKLISAIEQEGGAAKICGAGAICGKQAGALLVSSAHSVQDLVAHYGYELQTIQVDGDGTQII